MRLSSSHYLEKKENEMRKPYIKANEIEALKVKRNELAEKWIALNEKIKGHNYPDREDILARSELKDQLDKMIDEEDALKDFGREAA